jgi:hypothetical protein
MKRIQLSGGVSLQIEVTYHVTITVFTPGVWGERRLDNWLSSHMPSKRAWFKAFAARHLPWLAERVYEALSEGKVEWYSHSGWFSLSGRTHSAIL